MFRGERCDCTGRVKRRYSISTFRPAAQLASQADAAPFVGPAAGAASVSADLHGRHASRSSLGPRLRSSRRLARRRAVGTE
jgi:hypothetical protein